MVTLNNLGERNLRLYICTIILGFTFFFYFITPFRLFFYWKIPLLEDNITTLIWILPVLFFFPLYQFFKDSIPKNTVKILIVLMSVLYIAEIFAYSYVGIILIFEGFIISVLLIFTLTLLLQFYKQSSNNKYYLFSLSFGFLIAGIGAVFLLINSILYQILFAILSLSVFCLMFFMKLEIEPLQNKNPKENNWTKKSYLCLWTFIMTSIALVIYLIIGIVRYNLLNFPETSPEFQIYLIAMIIILFSSAGFVYSSYILSNKVNKSLLLSLGLTILALSYLLFCFFPNNIIYYVTVVIAGLGTSLFFHNLINIIFNVIQKHGKSLIFCLAISIYFDQLLMALLNLHGANNTSILGLLTWMEFIALIGIAFIIFSGATFIKKKVNFKFIFSQIVKVFLIILLLGVFLLSFSSSFFLDFAEKDFKVANRPPNAKIENSNLHEMIESIYNELQSNLRISTSNEHIFAIPGGDFYQKAVLWDTAYIAQIWKYFNVSISEWILENFINQINPNGLIPNTYHPLGISDTITQCPILTWACLDIYEFSGNKLFLENIYPKLKRYNQWWLTTRDYDGDGLYSWIHRDETGLDDSPRFDLYPMYQINAIDLNCYLVLQMKSLAKIAEILNIPEDSSDFTTKAEELTDKIRMHLWDAETGFFYDKVGENFIKVKTHSQFLPLFTGVASQEQSKRLVMHLNHPDEFNTTFPVSSVARNESTYSNMMWRGPTWINLNYLIVQGLINYNYTIEASKIAYKTLKMAEGVFNETDTFWEFYNSETGRIDDVVGKTGWTPASHYVGWDGLLTNLLIENLIGISFNISTISFYPILPSEWNYSLINLRLNEISMNLTLNNNQIKSNISISTPYFHNVTIINLQTEAKTVYYSPKIQVNFTNFNRYNFLIQ